MIMETLRESGDGGEHTRARRLGDFDGVTRAAALRLLLEQHVEPVVQAAPQRTDWRRLLAFGLLQVLIWHGPPKLTPAEAMRVLRASGSELDMTDRRVYPKWPQVTIIRSSPKDGPFGPFPPPPVFAPLNCCPLYVHPAPYPTIRVIR